MNDIRLNLNSVAYGGWKDIQINKSIDQITNTFGFNASDIQPGNADLWNVKMGDACTITIDGQTVITGYIEDMPISYDGQSHNINISGRDVTCDLIDCSYNGSVNEWINQSANKIIRKLCDPFDIDVYADNNVLTAVDARIEKFVIDQGETVGEIIAKLCRMIAVLPISLGDGKLTLTRAGATKTYDSLELGKNVKSADFNQSNKDRFSVYIVKGQGQGNDNKSVADFTTCTGQAIDNVITRDRPLVILADKPTTNAQCKDRARWEARLRAGQSRQITYEVQSWTQSNGDVWPINSLVRVKDHFLSLDTTLLISAINFSLNNSEGSITRLTVVDPTTYELMPEPITTDKAKVNSFDPRVNLSA